MLFIFPFLIDFKIIKSKTPWKAKLHTLVTSDKFEVFIMSFILLNMVVFMLHTHRQEEAVTTFFEILNYIFLFIFAVEAILKLSCMGCTYFYDSWNCFDFFIVCLTITTVILQKG